MRRLRNILLTLAGTLVILSMTCNSDRSDRQQHTNKQINYQMTESIMRDHPLPGIYENEAFQRRVNPHLYGENKK